MLTTVNLKETPWPFEQMKLYDSSWNLLDEDIYILD